MDIRQSSEFLSEILSGNPKAVLESFAKLALAVNPDGIWPSPRALFCSSWLVARLLVALAALEDVSWPGQRLAGDCHNRVMHFEVQALAHQNDGKLVEIASRSSAKGVMIIGGFMNRIWLG
jgi:hypothetical protein